MYKNKKVGVIGIILTILFLVILVFASNGNTGKVSFLENLLSGIVMPVQTGITYLKNKITNNDTYFMDMETIKAENEELKTKNSELEQSLRELEIIKAENATLKEYMNLKEKYADYTTIPAYIINKDIHNFSNVLVINVGSEDGIEENMTVIADQGLVGHIIEVSDHTAKVQTILNMSNAVSSTISTSRESITVMGTLQGNQSLLKAIDIPTDATLLEGDSVETSGLGGIYEKGIHIGTIKEVYETKNITDRYAIVEPAVNFRNLETVLVIQK